MWMALSIGLSAWLLVSCANRGMGPQGGPKDTTPPEVVKTVPENGALRYKGRQVEIWCNEYLQLNDVQNQVLISPPQQRPPEVRNVGKRVTVTFDADTELADSTTYAIEFGNAICDLNEKNPLRGYSFAFSTGDVIDTLELRGQLLNAENLNDVSGVYVGVHSCLADSAFEKLPFTRVARTDSAGHFVIHNMRPGKYRVYALRDNSSDYCYQPGEEIAFLDSLVSPSAPHRPKLLQPDSLHLDSLHLDSLALADSLHPDSLAVDTLPLPDSLSQPREEHADVVLYFFSEDKQRHYFVRSLREEQHKVQLLFSAEQDSLPVLRGLHLLNDTTYAPANWMDSVLVTASQHRDTVTLWLTDSTLIRRDTLIAEMRYRKTDSLYNWVEQTDTIRMLYRAPRLSDKAREAQEKKARERVLEVKANGQGGLDLNDTLRLFASWPVRVVRDSLIHLYRMQDTLQLVEPFTLEGAAEGAIRLDVLFPLQSGESYRVVLDSAALEDLYGVVNPALKIDVRVKKREDYATLKVQWQSDAEVPVRIQLLSDKDVPLRDQVLVDGVAAFDFVSPGDYYLRAYEDCNRDGHWTTGDWLQKRQPEPVTYSTEKLSLKANWDYEQNFVAGNKPGALRKNETKKRK